MGFLRCGKRVSYKTGLCRYDSFGPKRVGFGCFPTRFAQVAAAFAVSWACGRCACVRGAWEEGRGGDGVGAMGSCQGVFGCGGWWWWRAPFECPQDRPFDRLRANGEGAKCACDVGWRGRAAARRTSGYRLSPVRRWRVWEVGEAEAPRAAPLPWVPAKAGTTVGGGCAGRAGAVGGGGPRPAPLPWVPAFARTTEGGVCGTRGSCWWRRALRQAQGERRGCEARLRCGLVGACRRPAHLWIPAFAGTTMAGVGSSRGGGAPRRAPALGSRFRENDGGRGVRDTRGLVVAEGPSTGSGRTESR